MYLGFSADITHLQVRNPINWCYSTFKLPRYISSYHSFYHCHVGYAWAIYAGWLSCQLRNQCQFRSWMTWLWHDASSPAPRTAGHQECQGHGPHTCTSWGNFLSAQPRHKKCKAVSFRKRNLNKYSQYSQLFPLLSCFLWFSQYTPIAVHNKKKTWN